MLNLIDYEIELPFYDKLPLDYQNLLLEAERADNEDDLAIYINDLDAIDNGAKLLCMNGVLNTNQWDLIMQKYHV